MSPLFSLPDVSLPEVPRLSLPEVPRRAPLPRPAIPGLAGSRIPIWQEGRVPLERAALLRSGLLQSDPEPAAGNAPVLLIPGFLAGDPTLTLMARWLRRLGYRPCRAGMRANVDCTERALGRLEGQLATAVARHGGPVKIIGHSRGGVMARMLAVRRPDLIDGIATLGSPLSDMFAVHPVVRTQIRAVASLGSIGLPGLFSHRCREGACCEPARRDAAAPVGDVRFLSIYSRIDGIVDWRSCLDPQAEHVEVRSSHCGMAMNPSVYRVLAGWLAEAPGAGHQPAAQPLRAAA